MTEQEIILQQDTNGHHNRLFKRYMDLLNEILALKNHLASIIKATNKFTRQPNHHKLTLSDTIDDIYEDVVDTNLPTTFKPYTLLLPNSNSGRITRNDFPSNKRNLGERKICTSSARTYNDTHNNDNSK